MTLQVIIHGGVERRMPCLHMSGMLHIRMRMWVSAVPLVSVEHTALLYFIISDQASALSRFVAVPVSPFQIVAVVRPLKESFLYCFINH